MARNKYPEETVKLILDTAQRLFMAKGYDATSLQDIIDETKLSKGAIYHHFLSKEDIFAKICQRIGAENEVRLSAVRDNPHLNGFEKMREIFRSAVLHPNQEQIMSIVPYLLDNPRFLAMHIWEIFHIVVPDYIAPILEEGIKDGSIRAENPKELAEAVMVLADVWINPLLQPTSSEETRTRLAVFQKITRAMGLELFDSDIMDTYIQFSNPAQKNK